MKVLRVVLSLLFTWIVLKGISIAMRPSSLDRLLFEEAGISWLFWVFIVPALTAYACAIVHLWRPFKPGYRVAQAAVLIELTETIAAWFISGSNPQALKEAFIASRRARGLPVRPEILEMMESPAGRLFPLVLTVGFAVLLLFLLYRYNAATKKSVGSRHRPFTGMAGFARGCRLEE